MGHLAGHVIAVSLLLPDWLATGLDAATVAATAMFAWWVIQYTLTAPWWTDPIGSTLVMKDIVLLGILVPSSIDILWPGAIDRYTMAMIDFAVLWAAAIVMAWRSGVWYQIRRPRGDQAVRDALSWLRGLPTRVVADWIMRGRGKLLTQEARVGEIYLNDGSRELLRSLGVIKVPRPARLPVPHVIILSSAKGSNGRRLNVRCLCTGPRSRAILGTASSLGEAMAIWKGHKDAVEEQAPEHGDGQRVGRLAGRRGRPDGPAPGQ